MIKHKEKTKSKHSPNWLDTNRVPVAILFMLLWPLIAKLINIERLAILVYSTSGSFLTDIIITYLITLGPLFAAGLVIGFSYKANLTRNKYLQVILAIVIASILTWMMSYWFHAIWA